VAQLTEETMTPTADAVKADAAAVTRADRPDPEVVATAKRRQFSGAEKRRILLAADRCTAPGELGSLMRREGVYSSMLSNWRRQRAHSETNGLEARKRGPKPNLETAAQRKIATLQLENDRLHRRLAQAHEIIDIQKKLCNLLGLPTAEPTQRDA